MAFRTAKALHTPRRYRLLARPPFTVSFRSVAYRVAIVPVTGAPQWRLEAMPLDGRSPWTLCQAGEHLHLLERALYEQGFELLHPSAPALIMDQLCRASRAALAP